MAQISSMKQIGTRHLGSRVECLEWSNKMDLIAYGNEKGEVIIQRLNWQKIVTFPSPGEDVKVRSLSWQQDETTLAVGYSNGQVSLLDAEREEQISNVFMKEEADIAKVYFSKAVNRKDYRNIYPNHNELNYDFFLPQLPTLSGIGTTTKPSIEDHKSFAKGLPSFLIIVLKSGKVYLLLLGALNMGSIDLTQHLQYPNDFAVMDVRMNGDMNGMYALVRDGRKMKLLHFHNKLLEEYMLPMLHLSTHCGHILETESYINETINCMLEAWETVLIEMDNKLTKYAAAQPDGVLSADLLELLVFGYATQEIEDFLMEDLTEKGLKKLANSVDLSYSTIQTLVARPLQSAAINMFYFLNTIKGLSRIEHFYEPLISWEAADNALRLAGAFLMKVLEMQQVIDQCVSDMKLFFSWLCVVIARLQQQQQIGAEELAHLSPEDTIYLAEYLNSFEDSIIENDDGTVTKRKFNLEKVGQYLVDKPLQQLVKPDVHHLWNKLLEENECLKNCTLLYPHEKENSLMQQWNKLLEAVDVVFQRPDDNINASFVLQTCITYHELASVEGETEDNNHDYIYRSQSSYYTNESQHIDLFITIIGRQQVLLVEFDNQMHQLRCTRLTLQPGPFTIEPSKGFEHLNFVELQFYNEGTVSLLLQSTTNECGQQKMQSYFVQFLIEAAQRKSSQYSLLQHATNNEIDLTHVPGVHSLCDIIDRTTFKHLDGICMRLAVSGSRKVATILADDCRKMTIYEMEIEDDEDETEMSQNSLFDVSKESNTSAQE